MLNTLKKYLPKITWKEEAPQIQDLLKNNQDLIELAREMDTVNRALNFALAQSYTANETLSQESMTLLAAITLQHGGELKVNKQFIEALSQPECHQKLTINTNQDGNIDLLLVPIESESSEEDKKE